MLNSRVSELLGIKYPIIQGGMAWASYSGLVSAVSNAGGLGVLGSSTMSVPELKEEIAKTRKSTGLPFGVNIAIMSPEPDQKIETCIKEKVPVVITAAGSPKKYTDSLKSAGIRVGHVVPSLKLAKKAEDAGVDFIIAESTEAGGHDGVEEISNFTLIPLISKNIEKPLVAAGGIVNGRQIAAAFILGAEGVQMGTRFVATVECNAHERFKRGIIEADEAGTVFVARRYKPQRILRNPFAESIVNLESAGANAEKIRDAYGPNRGHKGSIEGDWKDGYFNCGQGAALIDSIVTVDELMKSLIGEVQLSTEELCSKE